MLWLISVYAGDLELLYPKKSSDCYKDLSITMVIFIVRNELSQIVEVKVPWCLKVKIYFRVSLYNNYGWDLTSFELVHFQWLHTDPQ